MPRAEVYEEGYVLVLDFAFGARTPIDPPFLGDAEGPHLRLSIRTRDGAVLHVPEDLRPRRPLLQRPSENQVRWTTGSSGGPISSFRLWLWPLPAAAPRSIVCEWPAQGIQPVETVLDSEAVAQARQSVTRLWEELRPLPPSDEDVVI